MLTSELLRRVALPRDQVLIIREVSADDIDALDALYKGLSDDDRYRRFFSVFHPGRSFFERLVRPASRGGATLVAEVTDATDDRAPPRLVAEAEYSALPAGNAELAITVDRSWRGWLGPYLLDVLVDVARARGVPHLEADILATNGAMFALVRHRGYEVLPVPAWPVVRVRIAAAQPIANHPAHALWPR